MPEPYMQKAIPASVAERAATRHTVDEHGCWVSDFYVGGNGYAHVTMRDPETKKDHSYLAHRASYTFANGPIPGDLVVDHRCFNRRCVNPAHLRAIPREENARRHGRDFPLGQCKWGHPLSATRYRAKGKSAGYGYCGTCQDDWNAYMTLIGTQVRLAGMSDQVSMGECAWDQPHPPHLWGETLSFPSGVAAGVVTWACSGEAKADDDD